MIKKVLIIYGLLGFILMILMIPLSGFATEDTGTLSPGQETGVAGTLMAAPTASPAASTFTSTQNVTLTSSGSSGICYTTDGTTPVCAASGSSCTTGNLYSSAISITSTKTVKARSCYPNSNSSSVGSHVYTISTPASPGGGYTAPTTTTTTLPTTTTTTIPVEESACQWCGLACIELQSWMYCPALTPAAGYICTEVNSVCTKVFGTVPTTTTTVPSEGGSVSALQARIAELQTMINNLLKQLGITTTTTVTVPGATTTTITTPPVTLTGIPEGFTFKNNLRLGMLSEDIRYLQRFLNSHAGTKVADTGLGSPGRETNYFGALTKAAVIKFQNMYTSEVLSQWGLTKGNGYVGQSTRKKLNELLAQ